MSGLPGGTGGGWLTTVAGTPTFPASDSVVLPPIAANAAVVTPGAAGSYVTLFPGDSLELIAVTGSSTAVEANAPIVVPDVGVGSLAGSG